MAYYNKGQVLLDNYAAMQIAFSLHASGKEPTASEKSKLKLYKGFGGIKEILLNQENTSSWSKESLKLKDKIDSIYWLIDKLPNSVDVKASLKNSVLTSFYTNPKIISALSEALKEHGVYAERYLDPCAGIGLFASNLKENGVLGMAYQLEKDLISSYILKALDFENHNTYGIALERASSESPLKHIGFDNFDLIASNIPFGDIKIYDKEYSLSRDKIKRLSQNKIHNYFILKSLDLLKEGGLMAHIMPYGVLNSESNKFIRQNMFKQADLISCVRLPNNTFHSAGTSAGSDFLILQKRVKKDFMSQKERLLIESSQNSYSNNEYFEKFPVNIIADEIKKGTDQYGKPALEYFHSGGEQGIYEQCKQIFFADFAENYQPQLSLAENVRALRYQERNQNKPEIKSAQLNLFGDSNYENVPKKAIPKQSKNTVSNEEAVVNKIQTAKKVENKPAEYLYSGEFLLPNKPQDKMMIEKDGNLYRLELYRNRLKYEPFDEEQKRHFLTLIQLRNTYEKLYDFEANNPGNLDGARHFLNEIYNNYLGLYGNLHTNKDTIAIDPANRGLLGLEYFDEEKKEYLKADIFTKNIFLNKQDFDLMQAFGYVINKIGYANLSEIATYCRQPEKNVENQLLEAKAICFNVKTGRYESYANVVKGNVIAKIKGIKKYEQNLREKFGDKYYRVEQTLNTLIDAIPKKIPFYDIDFNLGETWIPVALYNDFVKQLFKTPEVKISYLANQGEFIVNSGFTYSNTQIEVIYAVKPVDSHKILGDAMLKYAIDDEIPTITKIVGYDHNHKPIRQKDVEATRSAANKIEEIRAKFKEFLNNLDPSIKDYLENLYNTNFNCNVKPSFDGSHLQLSDLDLEALKIKAVYGSQKDAAWMLMQNGGGIVDHQVGTGKTLTMCITAHEMRRLGIAKKPMITGLKTNIKAIADTYKKAYPKDRVLFTGDTDFSKKRREEVLNAIKNNDWDCVIMTHNQFATIPQSEQIIRSVVNEEVSNINKDLETLLTLNLDISDSTKLRSGLEKRRDNLIGTLNKKVDEILAKKDRAIDFEEMGIDHIFVDEAHIFKNLTYTTRHKHVAGLGTLDGSDRALNMLFAIRSLQEKSNKDLGVTFLSGTTISNSLNELYTLFKYLRPKELERLGMSNFDAWIGTFGEKSSEFEVSVSHNLILKERYRSFIKVPELANLYAEITDYKTAESVGINPPKAESELIVIPQTADQLAFSKLLQEFAKTGNGPLIGRLPLSKNEEKAKMLIVTNTSKMMALDMRLLDTKYGDDPGNKVSVLCKKINDFYHQYTIQKATQLVFCDVGTPSSKNEFNLYNEIKEKLVSLGIPEKEIEYIQTAKTEKAKHKLIERTNQGEIRVLLGSTETLGTGVNAQEKIIAMHHMDIPYKPSEMEQRVGRGARQGNLVAEQFNDNKVFNFIYAVEQTLDSYKFNLLANKSLFIAQIKSSQAAIRRIDEGAMDDVNGMPYAEFMALTSGNTDILEKNKIDRQILALEAQKGNLNKEIAVANVRMREMNLSLNANVATLNRIEIDKNTLEQIAGYTIGGNKSHFSDYQTLTGEKFQEEGKLLGHIRAELEHPKTGTIGLIKYHDFVLKCETTQVNSGFDNEVFEHFEKNVYLESLKTGQTYQHNHGRIGNTDEVMMAFCDNALKTIPKLMVSANENIARLRENIFELEQFSQKTFQKENELIQLKVSTKMYEDKMNASILASKVDDTIVHEIPENQEEKVKSDKLNSERFNQKQVYRPKM